MDVTAVDLVYCTLCDRYFPTEEARAEHLKYAPNHPECSKCLKRFLSGNSLRNHKALSRNHNYCVACDMEFRTRGGLKAHIEFAAVHCEDSDSDDDDDSTDDWDEGWEDEVGRRMFPEEDVMEQPASDDEDSLSVAEYWDEDDESELGEDREAYYGFAAASNVGRNLHDSAHRDDNQHNSGCQVHPCPDHSHHNNVETEESSKAAVTFSCPLCLEACKDSSVTRCGHVFCTSCVKTALETKKLCPVCRKPAGLRQLRKIYLPSI